MTPAKTIVILAAATIMAMVMVWQTTLRRQAAYRMDALSRDIGEERIKRERYRRKVNTLKSPVRIETLVEKHDLRLIRPVPTAETPVQEADADTRIEQNRP